ncbi:MAG: CBS domain-containing protein, partial [Deltaproteobacteria bacterium]|nr:CBS domain-containing protein [Deltaproteobacteria bacterium]
MNVAFFLLPKEEVLYLSLKSNIKEALEKMATHRYSAIPILDEEGNYIGTVTEGDFLRKIKNTPGATLEDIQRQNLSEVPRQRVNQTVSIDAHIKDLLSLSINQNFVPVLDDKKH